MATVNQDELRTLTDFPTLDAEDSLASAVEGDATCVLSYDSSIATYIDLTTEFNDANADDCPIFPVTPQSSVDVLYIGADSPFRAIRFITGIAGVGATYYFVWKYWNGSTWVDLENLSGDYDYCKSISDKILSWTPAPDWATIAVDGNTKYWIHTPFYNTMSTVPVLTQGGLFFDSAAYSATPSDTLTLTDALTAKAVSELSDTLTLTDLINSGAISILSDTISLSDAISQKMSGALADGISLVDALAISVSQVLTDSLVLADSLQANAASILADALSIIDSLAISGTGIISLSDTITVADALVQNAGISASDALTLAEALAQITIKIEERAESMGMTDNLTGVLSDGMNLPGIGDVTSGDTIPGGRVRQPGSWRKAMDNNPSPITLYSRSSANTTFTPQGVVDANSWDLSDAKKGDTLITEDGYKAAIRSTGSNAIIVDSWIKGGYSRKGTAEDTPENGQQVSLHKPIRAKKVLIRAHDDNDNVVYIGFDENVHPDNGHPLTPELGQPNDHIVIEAPRDRWLNLSRIWIVSGTLQNVIVTAEGDEMPIGVSTSRRISDSFALTEELGQKAHTYLDDSLKLTDELTAVFTPSSITIEDSISLADNLSAVFTPGGAVDALYLNNIVYKNSNHVICNVGYKIGGVYQGSAIMSIDVNDPLNPSIANYVPITSAVEGSLNYESVLRGDYLYFAISNAAPNRGGLSIWDVSDPSTPVLSGELRIIEPVPGVDVNETYSYRIDVNQAGTRAGIKTNINEGFVIANVSNKAAPVEIDRGRPDYYDAILAEPPPGHMGSEWLDPPGVPDIPVTWQFVGGGADCKFTDSDSRISVAVWGDIWNLDVSNLGNDPNWIRNTSHTSHTLEVNGSIHYMLGGGDYPNNLQISSNAGGRGQCFVSISGTSTMNGIVYNNGYLYVAKASGLSIVDVSDPNNPSVVATTGHYARQQVAFNGNYMFVAAGSQGLRIYDITDPTSPVSLTQFLPY